MTTRPVRGALASLITFAVVALAPAVTRAHPSEAPLDDKPVTAAAVRTELPKAATALPLIGLIGFVSVCAGVGVHLLNGLGPDDE